LYLVIFIDIKTNLDRDCSKRILAQIVDKKNFESTIDKTSLISNFIYKFFKLIFVKFVIIGIYIESILEIQKILDFVIIF